MEKETVKWAYQDKAMKATFHWKDNCIICNNWLIKDELFYLITAPMEIRKLHHLDRYKLDNFVVHKDEWDEFSKGLTDEEVAKKLISHKKPRRKPLTENQLKDIEFFKEACGSFGYNKCVMSKDKRFVKMKKRKTSFTLIYDLAYSRISYDTNANEGLFGGLFSSQLVARIENKFNELKGLTERNDFTVAGVINDAIKQVDELMGKN